MGAVAKHRICVVDVSVYVCVVLSTLLTFKNVIFCDMTSLKPLDTNMWIWRTFETSKTFFKTPKKHTANVRTLYSKIIFW